MAFCDFVVKFDPKTDTKEDISKRVLYSIWVDRLKKKKPVRIFISGKSGEGKTTVAGTKVLMANGKWKKVEDIKVGEEVLSPQHDGSNIYSKVIKLHTRFSKKNYTVFEKKRGKRKLYTCSHNHLIPVYHRVMHRVNGIRKKENAKWYIRNYEAEALAKLKGKCNNYGISSFEIKKYKDRSNCEIEPYTLGIFLGDGHYNKCLNITTPDKIIMDEIKKHYKVMSEYNKGNCKSYAFSLLSKLATQLKKHGLKGKLAGDKFIPKEALLSDSIYRKKLLSGLIDSDGYYFHGGYKIVSKSKRLAKDILDLVYSLGGKGRIRKITKSIKKRNFTGKYYHVSFYLHKLQIPILTERRKRKEGIIYRVGNSLSLELKKAKSAQVYGFTLDSPSGFYITDNWMVTHNSYAAVVIQEVLCEIQGIDIRKYFETMNVFVPTEYSKKLKTLLFDKEFKKANIITVQEARDLMKATLWQTFLSVAIADVNAMSRQVKRMIFIIISQSIKNITRETRYTLDFYCTMRRPKNKKPRLSIWIMYIDERDLEKPKLRKRKLQGYLRYPNGRMRRLIPTHFEIPRPSKDLIEIFERKDFESKSAIIKNKLEKIDQEMKLELGDITDKVSVAVEWYVKHNDSITNIGKTYAKKFVLKKDVRENMLQFSKADGKRFEKQLYEGLVKAGVIELEHEAAHEEDKTDQ